MLDDWRGTPNLYVLGALVAAFLLIGAALIAAGLASASLDRFQQASTTVPSSFTTMQHSMLTAHTHLQQYLATGNTSHRDAMIDALSRMQQAERTYLDRHMTGADTINATNDAVSESLFNAVNRYEAGTSPDETRRLMGNVTASQTAALNAYRTVVEELDTPSRSGVVWVRSRIRAATMLLLAAVTLLVIAIIGVLVVGPSLPVKSRPAPETDGDLFDQVSAPVLSIRPSGTITAANDAAVDRFGYSRDALLGSDATLLFVDDITDTEVWETVAAGASGACDVTAVGADGEHHKLHLLLDSVTENDAVTSVRAVLQNTEE